jgi:hypothetical protein
VNIHGIGKVVKVVEHHPYRTFKPWDRSGRRIFYSSYESGDAIDKLEGALAEQVGSRDNHHGWTVESEGGDRYFVRFSDWTMSVWLLDATHRQQRTQERKP